MKSKITAIILVATTCVFLQACVTPSGMTSSNTPLAGKKIIQKLGKGEGSSDNWSFSPLCLANFGHPDVYEATEKAIKSKQGGDALINVHWYTTEYCLLMAKYNKLTVAGEVVILSDDYETKKK